SCERCGLWRCLFLHRWGRRRSELLQGTATAQALRRLASLLLLWRTHLGVELNGLAQKRAAFVAHLPLLNEERSGTQGYGGVVVGVLHLKQDREPLLVAGFGLLHLASAASHPSELRQCDAFTLPIVHLATDYQALAIVTLGLSQQVAMLRHFAQLV